jgi:DNA-binding NarL/FixJ family response regulator
MLVVPGSACGGFEWLEGVVAAAADPARPDTDGLPDTGDGWLGAARAIRAAERWRGVPIVALTGNAMPGDREACVAAGMDDYLAKPFSLTALRTMIDRWTGPSEVQSSGARAPR